MSKVDLEKLEQQTEDLIRAFGSLKKENGGLRRERDKLRDKKTTS